jgi:hypothetical protein
VKVIRWDDDGLPLAVPRLVETRSAGERWEILTSPYFRMEQLRLTVARGSVRWNCRPSVCFLWSGGAWM